MKKLLLFLMTLISPVLYSLESSRRLSRISVVSMSTSEQTLWLLDGVAAAGATYKLYQISQKACKCDYLPPNYKNNYSNIEKKNALLGYNVPIYIGAMVAMPVTGLATLYCLARLYFGNAHIK